MDEGTIGSMKRLGVTESYKLKRQVVLSASEAAEMIIRYVWFWSVRASRPYKNILVWTTFFEQHPGNVKLSRGKGGLYRIAILVL